MKVSQFVQALSEAQWRFASTMPQWPHVYTVHRWWQASEDFTVACSHIEASGRIIPWPSPPEMPIYHNRYLVLGAFKFWAMGPRGDQDGVGELTVINCAFADHDELLNCAPTDSVNHSGAWSDLSTRLSGLLHAGSTRGGETTRRPTS